MIKNTRPCPGGYLSRGYMGVIQNIHVKCKGSFTHTHIQRMSKLQTRDIISLPPASHTFIPDKAAQHCWFKELCSTGMDLNHLLRRGLSPDFSEPVSIHPNSIIATPLQPSACQHLMIRSSFLKDIVPCSLCFRSTNRAVHQIGWMKMPPCFCSPMRKWIPEYTFHFA